MIDAHRHSHRQSAFADAMAVRVHGGRKLGLLPAMGRGISQ